MTSSELLSNMLLNEIEFLDQVLAPLGREMLEQKYAQL